MTCERKTIRLSLMKILRSAGCQWLMPVILTTEEAEIKKITVQSQSMQIFCRKLSQGKKNISLKRGWWSGTRCRP
jgi:hypothetical protein